MRSRVTSLVLSRFRPDQPAAGAALRNGQNIHALARLGPVDVVSLVEGECDVTPVPGVHRWHAFSHPRALAARTRGERWRARCWALRRDIHPSVDRYAHDSIRRALDEILSRQRYDVAVVEELALARYIPVIQQWGCRVVFDAHKVESCLQRELDRGTGGTTGWTRIHRRWRHRRLLAEERRALLQADAIWVCSAADARCLVSLYDPAARVTVVPSGLDAARYRQALAVPADASWLDAPMTLSLLGTYSHAPNEQAALRLIRTVLPALRGEGYQPQLLLIGRDPTPAMRQAARADPAIHVTGTVDSVLPYLRRPSILTLPLAHGSGTQVKILEAFAAHRPVISTSKGIEGLEARDGHHLLVREHPREMARAVVQLWHRTAVRATLCQAAHQLVLQTYSWDNAARQIEASIDPLRPRPQRSYVVCCDNFT